MDNRTPEIAKTNEGISHSDEKSSNFDSTTTAKPVVAIKAVTTQPTFWQKRKTGDRETPLAKAQPMEVFITAEEKEKVWNRKDIESIQSIGARVRRFNKIHEDYVKNRGYRQVIILGSGFDEKAFKKNPAYQEGKKNANIYAQVKYFEVDRKIILDEKEKKLKERGIDKNATYVSCDYIKEDFIEKLVKAGADLNAPTLIIWEGNWMYQDDEEEELVLNKIKASFKEVAIPFDYFDQELLTKHSHHFSLWKGKKSGIDDINTFANKYGMQVESNKTSRDLVIEYGVEKNPAEDLQHYSVCTMVRR